MSKVKPCVTELDPWNVWGKNQESPDFLAMQFLENLSKDRVAFGKPLTGLQQVRHTLAEVKTDCMFSRVVTDQLIEAYANDDMDQQTVSMAKVKS